MEFSHYISSFIATANGFLWGYCLVILLLLSGIYFTIKTKLFQVSMLRHSLSVLKKQSNAAKSNDKTHISSFEALSTSLASIVGVGAIAGMAIAISLGGPGTIFWVWVIAFVGMATSLVENTLGQIYKTQKDSKSMFMGGPSYYLLHGLKNKFLASSFSVLLIITFGIAFNSVQANTIGGSLNNAFNIDMRITGLVLTILTFLIIFGGIKRIASISSFLVPLMGMLYLGIAITVILLNLGKIPALFVLIVKSAFGFGEIVAGGASYMFLQTAILGIKRALFSTEAGLGSAPNISSSATVDHPVQQSILSMLGVFFVAFVICTSTAFIVLLSDNYTLTQGVIKGVDLVQDSLKDHLGSISVYLLSICIFVFGFTSIIGNYSYAENNITFLTKHKYSVLILRIVVLFAVYFGTVLTLQFVWDLADLFMGLMILINLYALARLSKVALETIADYKTQVRAKKSPKFEKSNITSLKDNPNNTW